MRLALRKSACVEKKASCTYYFQAKSLDKHKIGRTSPWIQNTELVNRTGTTPLYTVEKPSLGATVA